MEFTSFHHSDAWNFELIPRFLKKIVHCCRIPGQTKAIEGLLGARTTACSAGGRAKCGVQHLMLTMAMTPL
jgi:hypothetical protein